MESKAQSPLDAMDGDFFSFPYEPYSIQLDLMRQLWETLERGHCGIFESPTGTGKSISLICGALTWLTKHTDELGLVQASQNAANTDAEAVEQVQPKISAEPSWLSDFEQKTADREVKFRQQMVKEALAGIEKLRLKPEATTKKRKMAIAYNHNERKRGRQSSSSRVSKQDGDDADEHLVDAYDSDRVRRGSSDSDGEGVSTKGRFGEEKPDFGVVKIIYCSRTHSQISQFVREIRKTSFAERVRVVSLGSRKNLCTNPNVTKLSSDLRMTDKCLDMMQSGKTKNGKKVGKCPFYEKELLSHYKDYALAHVQDIEDLHTLGEDMSICSYYGTRESIPLAQIVTVPYSLLLSKDARETLGLGLENNIVIFDEAHNIIDAINNTYKVEITSKQLVVARRSLWSYFTKYEKRFKGKNAFYIKQLLSILECLTKFLRQLSKSAGKAAAVGDDDDGATGAQMMTVNDFLFSARIDHFNMFKILEYLSESGLAKKLMGFVESTATSGNTAAPPPQAATENSDEGFESRHISPLRTVEALLKALTGAGADGRILAQPHNASKGVEGLVRFILLNPVIHFQEIVKKSRSVILAGGTMQPVSQVIDQLFSSVPREDVDLFSCGHVIPPEKLLGFSLAAGPSQKHLEFTYSRRGDMEALDELGRILFNLSRIVPAGVVVFFPSYRFEENAVHRWQTTKQYEQIQAKKAIFREPKKSDELAEVLMQYSTACSEDNRNGSGAMLLSVVGGKMSEGINFNDELARCVVMVGMPYPNARDAELVEKMAFLDKRIPGSGRQFYESLCMKAVNQSIGRSIRHQKDYSTILLVDHRYSSSAVRSRLPEWIQNRVQPPMSFGQVYSQLVQFYRAKESKSSRQTQ
ncbi:ATP-dependent DNA helicase [Phytophthora fragariae]|uniref:ATP-dependent DNA helicase n=1 Tax=Phytophthora fragariae TaxID=53985 RepID=A0A6A3RTV4_9STRA|nr:ATP-dependent DNA helicase [Phytophthora fragariae]KAE9100221.1 ATP-dependent DNA helicase [Phytophthora fragariae]